MEKKLESAISQKDPNLILETKNYIDLYDSLQLAHKIILNSFLRLCNEKRFQGGILWK